MRIAILGTGNVGTALATGWLRAKHEVKFGSREPKKAKPPEGTAAVTQKEAAAWGDVIVLAVPFPAVREVVNNVGPSTLKGKTVVDVTNALTPSYDWAVGFSTSGAEELAKLAPGARVVKAFNTVFAQNMSQGKTGGETLTAFVAGDDAAAKQAVLRLASDLGFDPVDAGPLKSARYLEPMGLQHIALAFQGKMGPGIGLKLVRGK